MGVITNMNSVDEGSIAAFNTITKSAIGYVDGQNFPIDSISLSTGSLYYETSGLPYDLGYVVVTSSGAWSASILSDPNNIIDDFTTSGSDQGQLAVTVLQNTTITDCHSAVIRVTRGTVYEDLTIYQDGTVLTC